MARKSKSKAKIKKTMGEFKRGDLHSGSKQGPKVKDRKQAVAIALNQAREAGRNMGRGARKARDARLGRQPI
jgi:hypothetical protein